MPKQPKHLVERRKSLVPSTCLQSIGPLKCSGCLKSLHVVGVGVDVPDDSLCVDQEGSGDRQSQGIISIASLQVDSEGVKDTLEGLGLVPNDAELSGEFVANIGQDFKLELVLLSSRERGVGKLRRDGNDGHTLGLEVIQVQLQGAQSQVAEGAPVATVESDQDWALGKEALARHFLAESVGELEARESSSSFNDGVLVKGGLEVGNGLLDG